eukprot:gb/GECH01010432.1/.p1 GENE.gb/GECH01010432.1/~~gb/GECH01010432.1/.p1  ORF type:complete len:517 (+),score=112.67 gb/GECH01010432.1/:1-1551(+)
MVEIDGIIPPETTILVTGGGGYVGLKLVKRLVEMNIKCIHIFDLHICEKEIFNILNENSSTDITIFKGDIRDPDIIHEACKNVDLVFHIASLVRYDMLASDVVSSINVKGTENVIHACIKNRVPKLVYISSNTVVFNGKSIEGKNEEDLKVIPKSHRDPYSASKSIAETFVLQSDKSHFMDNIKEENDSFSKHSLNCDSNISTSLNSFISVSNEFNSDIDSSSSSSKLNCPPDYRLRTVSLRPGGIYGEGEQKHLPRMFRCTRLGIGGMAVQDLTSKQDMIHVDNLIDVMICSAIQLIQNPAQIGGEAFFVSDDEPINNFEFFRRIYHGVGYSGYNITLPFWMAYIIALILELIHWCLGRFIPFEPPLTRFEVYKVGISHHFSIEKARRLLKWTPKISTSEGLNRMVKFYTNRTTPETCYYRQDTPSYTWSSCLTLSNLSSLSIISLIVMFCGWCSTPFLYTLFVVAVERIMAASEVYEVAYDYRRVDLFYWMMRSVICGKRETMNLLRSYIEDLK